MARASFILRKGTSDKGSYLQYPIDDPAFAARPDNDNYLRADTLQLVPTAPILTGGLTDTYLEAICINYDTVVVNWRVVLDRILGPTPVPYQMFINYDNEGAPRTINKGITLTETNVSGVGSVTFQIDDGTLDFKVDAAYRWAYFTLFIRYLSNAGDDYYEPIVSVKVLIPDNYGSTDALYYRIPEYYRTLDEAQNTNNNPEGGPLRRFLSVFGWELDTHRTLIDYLMTMKDPQIAEQTALDALANDFGIGLLSRELGSSRVRQYLNSIGDIRRGKGTLDIVHRSLRALTECNVEYDPSASPTPTIKIYAQRVNLVSDPRLSTGITGSIDGGNPYSTYGPGFEIDAGEVGTSQTDGTYDGGNSVTPEYSSSTPLSGGWASYPDGVNPGYVILERVSQDIKVIGGDVLYFSTHVSMDVQDLIDTVMLYTTAGYSELTGEMVADATQSNIVGTTRYWRLEVPDTYTSYVDAGIVIRFAENPSLGADDFDYMLLERNNIGEYFDGNTKRGGWIVDGGGAVSDYAWTGTANESMSVYTDNLQKVKYTVRRLVPSILPVTELVTSGTVYSNRLPTTNLNYAITYNNIPGV